MGNHILDIRDLYVWYRTYEGYSKVLDGVDFNVNKGKRWAWWGRPVVAKTTTMRSVLGILPEGQFHIPKGEILYHGRNILKMKPQELHKIRSEGMSMIFQEPSAALNPVFTIGSQIFDVIKYSGETAPGQGQKTRKKSGRRPFRPSERYIPDRKGYWSAILTN